MSTSPLDTRVQEQNCCFWVKHSESCAQVKHAGAAIVAALAAIALAGGVLLILAQQGFDLAGINSIAQMVEAKWIYLGMGIVGAVTLIDVTFIIAQVHSYLNKTVPDDELKQGGFSDWLSNKHIVAQLAPRSFVTETTKLTQYVIVSKDEDGNASYIAFRTQEESDYHQIRLQQKGYENLQDLQAKSQEYRAEYLEALIGSKRFQKWNNALCEGLEKGYYMDDYDRQTVSKIVFWPLAAFQDEYPVTRFFKTEEARNATIDNEYAALRNLGEIEQLAEDEYKNQVLVALQMGEFWQFIGKLREETIYFVAYQHEDNDVTIHHSFTVEVENEFLNTLPSTHVNAKNKFFKTHNYTPKELDYLTDKRDIQQLTDKKVESQQYENINLPMVGRENLWVYAWKAAAGVEYFKTERQRQDYIEKHYKGLINAQLVREQEVEGI